MKLFAQWNEMLDAGRIPVFEFKCSDKDGDEDFYTFDIGMHVDGITFSIPDSSLKCFFSGGIKKLSDLNYLLPFDEYFASLDYYLQEIYQEISKGYLIPNNLQEVE